MAHSVHTGLVWDAQETLFLITDSQSACNFSQITPTLSDHPKPANGYHLKTGQRE
jgi:hypothetical protein